MAVLCFVETLVRNNAKFHPSVHVVRLLQAGLIQCF